MKLHFLGTGTSFGIPVIGCGCETCRSLDPRDRRTRHAVLLEDDGRRLLVDTPPELREQLLRARVGHVDAVWITHQHADHTHGIDDLRVFSVRSGAALPIHASAACLESIQNRFDYVFDELVRPLPGTSKPEGEPNVLQPYRETEIAGFRITPLPVPHGPLEVFGFRVGDLGYVTDAKILPEETFQRLKGVRTLVLNALWFGYDHPTHFNVEEAIEVARSIGAERTYLTHLTHLSTHSEFEARLPEGILPAYDGLVVNI